MKPLSITIRAAMGTLACLTVTAAAHAATISASGAWVRWLPSQLPAAGYVTLANTSDKPVDLLGASSADYGSVMLHRTVSNGSTSQMIMVHKVTIPAHGALKIAPGGYHFMLEKATHKIAPGDTIHLHMQFSDGSSLDTPFAVKSPGQTQ